MKPCGSVSKLCYAIGLLFAGGVQAQHLGVWLDEPLNTYAMERQVTTYTYYSGVWPLDLDGNGLDDVQLTSIAHADATGTVLNTWHHGWQPDNGWRIARDSSLVNAWAVDSGGFISNGFSYRDEGLRLHGRTGSLDFGHWRMDSVIRYLPIKRGTDTAAQYGWVALTVDHRPGIRIHGWGISDDAGAFLNAGSLPAPSGFAAPSGPLTVVNARASALPGDWTLKARLPIPATGVESYRVFIVRAHALGAMDAPRGMMVPSSRYLSFPAGTSTLNLTIPDTLKDAKGHAIVKDSLYRICVLSVVDSMTATEPSLVISQSIRAERRVKPVQNLVLFDSLDRFLASDFHFTFETPDDTTGIAGYRLIWEHQPEGPTSGEPDTDTLWAQAATAAAARVYDLPPSLGTIQGFLPDYMRTVDGDNLKRSRYYRIWVISVPRSGGNRPNAAPSHGPSPTWPREAHSTRIPDSIVADGVLNHAHGRSIRWSFGAAVDENGIAEYRVYPHYTGFGGTSTFTTNDLIARPDAQYKRIVPDGSSSYSGDLEGILDQSGTLLIENALYRLAVLAIGDSSNFFSFSNHRQAESLVSFSTMGCVTGTPSLSQITRTGTTADFEVVFDAPTDTVGLEGYKVFLFENGLTPSLSVLINAPDSQQLALARTVLIDTLENLSPLHGEPFMLSFNYRAVVINVPDSIDGSVVLASPPSLPNAVIIPEWKVQNLEVEDGSNYGDGRDLDVTFDPAMSEGQIVAYRVACWPAVESKTPNDVLAAPPGHWVEVPPGASSYAVDFDGATDLNGSPIEVDRLYEVMVLSRSVPGIGSEWLKSSGSISGKPLDAQNAAQLDVGDFEDARDWRLIASPAQYEDSVAEYRAYVMGTTSAFPKAAELLPLPADRYQVLHLEGPDDTTYLRSTLLDQHGDSLAFSTNYRLAVLSVPLPGSTLDTGLVYSEGESSFRDEEWQPERPNWTVDSITGNLFLHTEGCKEEHYITEYRGLVLTSATWGISVEEALALPDNRYVAWEPDNSSSYSISMYTGAKDVSGFSYPQPGQVYFLRVLAFINSDTARLSPASTGIVEPVGLNTSGSMSADWSIGLSAEGLVLYGLPEAPVRVRIHDVLGRTVGHWETVDLLPNGNAWQLNWPRAGLPENAWWLLDLETENSRYTKAFVR